jgi:predicted ester cyclase
MSAEANTAIVRRFFEEVVNGWNLAAADELVAHDFIEHGALPGLPPGRDGFKQFLAMLADAFPDLHVTIEDILTDRDKVVVRLSIRGTHRGELMGIPPTNKPATWSGIDIVRIAGGKMAERWGERDLLRLMEQLGVTQPPQ